MLLLPTLNRIDKLKAFLASAKETETSTPGRILIDGTDFAMNEDLYAELDLPPGWVTFVLRASRWEISAGNGLRLAILMIG